MARNTVKGSTDSVDQSISQGEAAGDAGTTRQREPKMANGKVGACPVCSADLTRISMIVDNNSLLMESCDVCDIRRWQFAGEQIDLQHALEHVGEHAGRRR